MGRIIRYFSGDGFSVIVIMYTYAQKGFFSFLLKTKDAGDPPISTKNLGGPVTSSSELTYYFHYFFHFFQIFKKKSL